MGDAQEQESMESFNKQLFQLEVIRFTSMEVSIMKKGLLFRQSFM